MKTQIACFGEVLWDMLPSGKIAGGAPMNVACQLTNLGNQVAMISRIGSDDLGREIFDFLDKRGVDVSTVQVDAVFPTGIVKVNLSPEGQPHYEIVLPSAWDYIEDTDTLKSKIDGATILVFGSLSCRNNLSKETLLSLIPHFATTVFDANLRAPFYSPELIDELGQAARIIKVNDEELIEISSWFGLNGTEQALMEDLLKRFDLNGIIQTKGNKGAMYFDGQTFSHHPGFKVQVRDTIGSGDAFLAGFLHGFLNAATPDKCLAMGCGMGALTATYKGGTPLINPKDLASFLNQ